jgi:uncharacterized protein (TIGR03437 family)
MYTSFRTPLSAVSMTTTGRLSSLGLIFVALLISHSLRAQSSFPPEVYSANNSADYSTTIAQGSLFAVFGYYLGPADLVQVSAFPLPSVLSGTSVTVTSGSTTLNCPMLYTSIGQVAAILPSNTPVGAATVTVAYNGHTDPSGYSTTQVTVAVSSVGLYTTSSSGLGTGIFTNAVSGALKTLANSAAPGELVFVWGTGIGPINGPDNALPPVLNFPNVKVLVGDQSAQIYYAGRSGCCSGVDETAFYVPAGVSGCNVPVTFISGGISSNTVTMPVSASGGACSDSGPTLPTSILTKAAAGQPVRLAVIAIGPASILETGSEPRAVAVRLSAALHTRVSEADAARLIRAYRTGNARAIRTAMAKYASRWKALDAQTKAMLTARISSTQDTVLAEFGGFSSESVVATVASAQFPPVGECLVLPNSFPSGLGSLSAGLDAGAALMLTGAAGSFTLTQTSKGQYRISSGPSVAGPNVPLGTYTISGTGGKDVGAFSGTVIVASHLALSNKSSLATVDRTQPLTVTWTGGVAGSYVLLGGGSTRFPHSYFVCAEDAGKGTFTIPSYILSSINATTAANGILWISPNPLSNQIAIPGIDAAYFADGSNDSVNVAFGNTNAPSGPNGSNVSNVTGSIDGLYPASGASAAQNGGMSTTGPVTFSELLTAGTFTTAFDISPGASPFTVEAMCPAGSAVISINPAQNTWQATYIVPTAAARLGDFSGDGVVVTDYTRSAPFPNNEVPVSRLDPIAVAEASVLPLPNVAGTAGPNGTWSASGTLPAGGHFTIGNGASPLPGFGGFINLVSRGAQSVTFTLKVDGKLVASKQISFTTD